MKRESMEMARESFRIEAKAILDVLEHIDEVEFSHAVDSLSKAERIVTCACGNSGVAAMKLSHSLCCIERPARFLPPGEAVHGGLGCVKEGDVVVLVSRGGKTSELMPILRISRAKKAIVIGVTENLDSPLARQSDIVLHVGTERECDRFNVMSTASFVSYIAVFDALQIAIMEETGFTLPQFALIHPGGAVGVLLNESQDDVHSLQPGQSSGTPSMGKVELL
jgi:D-arabinose 5-phosphate isomerase GutQ